MLRGYSFLSFVKIIRKKHICQQQISFMKGVKTLMLQQLPNACFFNFGKRHMTCMV